MRNETQKCGIPKEKSDPGPARTEIMAEKNDNEELKEFVTELTEHQIAIRSFIGYLMPGSGDVGDVLQEVNLLLWEKRNQFTLGTDFRAWAFASARFVVLGYQRKWKRRGDLILDDALVVQLAEEWENESYVQQRRLKALESCLEKLEEDDVTLLTERYRRYGNVERLAQARGQKSSALRVRLLRLRAALKQCVQKILANPEVAL